MHRSLIMMLRWIDVRIIYAFVAIFIIPVTLVVSPGARVIYRYFRNIWHQSPIHAVWSTYLNHCKFSQVIIDRFAIWAGKKYIVKVNNIEAFNKLSEQPEGFVILSAHIGIYEIAGYHLNTNKVLNALVYAGEKETVMANRYKRFAEMNIRMIPTSQDMSHIFAMDNALTNGEIVSMPADRLFGSPKSLSKSFLGHEAKFPMGPFNIATMRGYDVLGINVMKTKWNEFSIYVANLNYDKQASRRQQVAQLSDAYVAELECRVRQYPHQWFNFFDFWENK
ncbi:MAG: lipid A biosynthesis acyltransferase [Bacteroidia bacterium]|nr:lipid A biosynthesis acyltransferase [Bacteroidia bacterium]